MKDILFSLLTFLFPLLVFGQEKEMIIPKNKNGDLDYSFLMTQKRVKGIKIVDLTKSKLPFQIRLWTTGQLIEIWRNKDSTTAGQIITYTREVDKYGDPKKNSKMYTKTKLLSETVVSDILVSIDSLNILGLKPTDSIPQWRHGTDGYSYIIEFATETKYVFKDYWGCSYQDIAIIEAVTIENFFNKLKMDVNLKGIQESFTNGLPNGCYNNYGMTVICKGKRYVR